MANRETKLFTFANDAAEDEYRNLPPDVKQTFDEQLRRIQNHQDPTIKYSYLSVVGSGVIELKINGSPAFRCVYIAKYKNTVAVLHSFSKTTNGVDKPAMELAKKRLKEFKKAIAEY